MTLSKLIKALTAIRDATGDVSVRIATDRYGRRSRSVGDAQVIFTEENAFEPFALITAAPSTPTEAK